jgi:hypothetical protein
MSMLNNATRARGSARQGSALLMTLVMMVGLAVMGASLLAMGRAQGQERRAWQDRVVAELGARSGVAEAWARLEAGEAGALGVEGARVPLGGATGWVEVDHGGSTLTVTSTAVAGHAAERARVTFTQETSSLFRWAAFGDEGLVVRSNARTDSFDSRLGAPDAAPPLWNGDVGSNADILVRQNAQVGGRAVSGPGGAVTQLDNALIVGGIHQAPASQELPPIEVPGLESEGSLTVTSQGNEWGSGPRAFDDLEIGNNSSLTIEGPATIVCNTFRLRSNARLEIDAEDGPVRIFVIGDFLLHSNAFLGSDRGRPSDLEVNLVSDNVIDPDQEVDLDEVDFDSNTEVWGTVYAPNAVVEIDSNLELFGSLVARRVILDSNCQIHYDEALAEEGPHASTEWTLSSWLSAPVSWRER